MSNRLPDSDRLSRYQASVVSSVADQDEAEESQFVKCMTIAFVGTLVAGFLYPIMTVAMCIFLPVYQSILRPQTSVELLLVLAGLLAVSMLSFSISMMSFIVSSVVIWVFKIWYARLFLPRIAFAIAGGLSGAIPFIVAFGIMRYWLMIVPFFLLAVAMGHFGAVIAGYRSQYQIQFLQPVIPSQFPIRLIDLFILTVAVAVVLLLQRLSGLQLVLPLTIYLGWQFVLLIVDEWIRGKVVQAMFDRGTTSV